MSSKNNKRKRAPRTPAEINNAYNGSSRCIRCVLRHDYCIFDEESTHPDQCIGCKLANNCHCQPIGSSFLQYSKTRSKLGQRKACLCCVSRGQKCVYDNDDEWDYKSQCEYCTQNSKVCWPLVKFNGMRSSKLLSGVCDNFAVDHNLADLVASIVSKASSDFKATVDFPMNCNAVISTQRPARARNNFGTVVNDTYHGNTLFQEIVSYGSGSGAVSVGSTHK